MVKNNTRKSILKIMCITIFMLVIFILFLQETRAATCNTCTGCDTEAGTSFNIIQLTRNIASNESCINVKANNIIIDCQGYEIQGNISSANSTILIDEGFNNTLIKNCNITNAYYGINVRKINAFNLTLINTTIYNNSYGIAFSSLHNSTFFNVTIMNNSQTDIYINKSINMTFLGTNLAVKITSVESVIALYNITLGNSTTNLNLNNLSLFVTDTMFNTTNDLDLKSNTLNVLNNSEIYNRSTAITISFNTVNSTNNNAYTILKDNIQCSSQSCSKLSNTPRIFNATGLNNYTTINLTCGSFFTTSINLEAGIMNSTGGNTCNGDGINLNASNVIFDCNGYEILGNHTSGTGAYFSNVSNSSIKNCKVSLFRVGIILNHSSNSFIFNNSILVNNTLGAGILVNRTGNTNISYNKIETNGTNSAGIVVTGLTASSNNYYSEYNNITNNIIYTYTTLSGSNAQGIKFLKFTRFNRILDNNITTSGGGSANAITLSDATSNSLRDNIIAFNNLTTNGSTVLTLGLSGVSHNNVTKNTIYSYRIDGLVQGLQLNTDGGVNNITENIIYIEGGTITGVGSHGMRIQSSGNLIKGNNITTFGVEASAIYLRTSTLRNNITQNNLTTYNNNSHVIYLDRSNSNKINDNLIQTTGYNASGIIFGTGTTTTNITSNIINSLGIDGKGIYSVDVGNVNYSDLTINATLYDFYLLSSNGTTMNNITSGTYYYINETNITANNLTLTNENGSINFNFLSLNTTLNNIFNTSGNIIINSNFVRINTTLLTGFNSTANITINGISFTDPKPRIDLNDNEAYADCSSCTEISYAAGKFIFTVPTFTTYTSIENAVTPSDQGGGSGGGESNGGGGPTKKPQQSPTQPIIEEQPKPQAPQAQQQDEETRIIETDHGKIKVYTKKTKEAFILKLNSSEGAGELLLKFVNVSGIKIPKIDIKLSSTGSIRIKPTVDVELPLMDINSALIILVIIIIFIYHFINGIIQERRKKLYILPQFRYMPVSYTRDLNLKRPKAL